MQGILLVFVFAPIRSFPSLEIWSTPPPSPPIPGHTYTYSIESNTLLQEGANGVNSSLIVGPKIVVK